MISLEQFKAKYPIGSSVGNPGTNTYVGQCVSYVRRYIEEVHGIKTIINGHASNYYNSAFMAQHYDKVPQGQEQNGDILCWGNDAGTMTGAEGHIAIRYAPGQMLNQNYGGSLRVSINPFFSAGYQGALRLKPNQGGNNMAGIDATDLTAIYELGPLHRSRTPGEGENVYLGKTANFVLRDHANSTEGKNREAALAAQGATITNLTNENTSLKATITTLKATIVTKDATIAAKDKEIATLKAQLAAGSGGNYTKVIQAGTDLYTKVA